MAPTKKIVVCCDGTGNDSDGTLNVPTNIAKIARCLNHAGPAVESKQQIPQLVYYQSGVGTRASGKLGWAFDSLTGRGITENIRSAYSFICNNYEPDDEIYLIGFSRGAYTARCISTLINDIGILTKHSLGYFYDIFHAWQAKNIHAKSGPPHSGPNTHAEPPRYKAIKEALTSEKDMAFPDVRIVVCAVFDTVGSLGIAASETDSTVDYIKDTLRGVGMTWIPGLEKGTEAFEFVDTVVSPNIDNAFQALALDEHRGHFPPTVWENPDPQTKTHLEQCWFAGCHSHIGGGVEDNVILPSVSLAWMLEKLSPFLSFNADLINCTHSDDALLGALGLKDDTTRAKGNVLTDSRRGFYLLDGNVPRTPGQYRTHRKADGKVLNEPLKNSNETIHHSVRTQFWDKTDMLADKEPYQPLALKNRWHLPHVQPWGWKYQAHADKVPDLPEAEQGQQEKRILGIWSEGYAGATK